MQMMEKKMCGKRKKNHLYDQGKRRKKLEYLNFLLLLENCASLTLYLTINFFKIKISFLIKIKNLINIV